MTIHPSWCHWKRSSPEQASPSWNESRPALCSILTDMTHYGQFQNGSGLAFTAGHRNLNTCNRPGIPCRVY